MQEGKNVWDLKGGEIAKKIDHSGSGFVKQRPKIYIFLAELDFLIIDSMKAVLWKNLNFKNIFHI